MTTRPHPSAPPTPAANHTAVVPRLQRPGRLTAAAAGWALGWCWCRWGLDWVAGMSAIAAPTALVSAGLREAIRRHRAARRDLASITTWDQRRMRAHRALTEGERRR